MPDSPAATAVHTNTGQSAGDSVDAFTASPTLVSRQPELRPEQHLAPVIGVGDGPADQRAHDERPELGHAQQADGEATSR